MCPFLPVYAAAMIVGAVLLVIHVHGAWDRFA